MMNTDEQWLNPEAVIEAVCQVSGLSRDTIMGRDRTQPVSMARKIMCHLLYKRSNVSVEGIGHLMSDRDHTSILYLKKQCAEDSSTTIHYAKSVYRALILNSFIPHFYQPTH